MRKHSSIAMGITALVLVATGCSQDSAKSEADPGTFGSGGAGGSAYVDPTQCTRTTCDPPSCCGQPCGANGTCCAGTICGTSGKCIPEECSYCGDLGCTVDFTSCTATCNAPSCCLTDCLTDTDCCAGTHCDANTAGVKKCFPNSCDACGGMTSTCQTTTSCETSCIPPTTCGTACSTDVDCGTGSRCNTFDSGKKLCVPNAYQDECNACSGNTCTFHPSTCEVSCPPVGAGGSGGAGASGGAGGFGGTTSDGGTGGSPQVDAGTGGATQTSCASCCEPCGPSQPCCPGSICDPDENNGNKLRCIPEECSGCEYGCTFYCP